MKNKVCAVIMASGHSKRLGADKLLQTVGGVTVIERCFRAVSLGGFSAVAVVARDESVLSLARQYGFTAVYNDDVTDDTAVTIRLGVAAVLEEADGVALVVADQPFFKSAGKLRLFFLENADKICAVSHSGQRGNPVVFPADLLPELMSLAPGGRGKDVIKCHAGRLALLEVDEAELLDIDTPSDLAKARKMI